LTPRSWCSTEIQQDLALLEEAIFLVQLYQLKRRPRSVTCSENQYCPRKSGPNAYLSPWQAYTTYPGDLFRAFSELPLRLHCSNHCVESALANKTSYLTTITFLAKRHLGFWNKTSCSFSRRNSTMIKLRALRTLPFSFRSLCSVNNGRVAIHRSPVLGSTQIRRFGSNQTRYSPLDATPSELFDVLLTDVDHRILHGGVSEKPGCTTFCVLQRSWNQIPEINGILFGLRSLPLLQLMSRLPIICTSVRH